MTAHNQRDENDGEGRGHLAVITECMPCRWRATLDARPVDGEFTSVEAAAAAVTDAMRERYGLIPAS